MKVIRGIGLFVIYPCMMFGLGICMGLFLNDFSIREHGRRDNRQSIWQRERKRAGRKPP